MPREYRLKPQTVTAARFKGTAESLNKIHHWITDNGGKARSYPDGDNPGVWFINLDTPNGPYNVQAGDYILLHGDGWFSVESEAAFKATYDEEHAAE